DPADASTWRRSDVDRQHVEAYGRPVATDHPLANQVNPDRLGPIELGARETGERPRVDVCIVEAVMARDETRKHTGVRGFDLPGDEGEAHAGLRPHAEIPQQDRKSVV